MPRSRASLRESALRRCAGGDTAFCEHALRRGIVAGTATGELSFARGTVGWTRLCATCGDTLDAIVRRVRACQRGSRTRSFWTLNPASTMNSPVAFADRACSIDASTSASVAASTSASRTATNSTSSPASSGTR